MKNSKVILAAVISSLMSVSAMANNLAGTVTFTGNLIAAPCIIDAATQNVNINFGHVIADNGSVVENTREGEIKLGHCNFATIPGVSRVEVKFSGLQDLDNADLLRITGSAKGVGIRFMNATGHDLALNNGAISVNSAGNSDLSIKFKTKVVPTVGPIIHGDLAANATYSIEYK
nr:fimbrial protein [uncultured Moellerella sp.]